MKEKFSEVRCDYYNAQDNYWRVDAWETPDDDEGGKVIAVINGTTGDVFHLEPYLNSPLADEVIAAKVKEIKAALELESCSTPEQMANFHEKQISMKEATLRKKINEYAIEKLRSTNEDNPFRCKIETSAPESHLYGVTGPTVDSMYYDEEYDEIFMDCEGDEIIFGEDVLTTDQMLEIIKNL